MSSNWDNNILDSAKVQRMKERVWNCKYCKVRIDVDSDLYIAINHRTEINGQAKEELVHSACWDPYSLSFPHSRMVGDDTA